MESFIAMNVYFDKLFLKLSDYVAKEETKTCIKYCDIEKILKDRAWLDPAMSTMINEV